MFAAVDGVAVGPALDGFFAVGEEEPDAVAIERLAAQVVSHFDQQAGG